uniref:RING-type domain-containing protein n=1 Tax=Mesocestoides corti TaxID=53468 RepID=A0A5K3ELB9_MESCO
MSGFAEDLICEICHQLLRDPHMLPCGHSYCLHPCILNMTDANIVFCPQCFIESDASLIVPDESTNRRICIELSRRMSENANNRTSVPSKLADPPPDPSECAECKAQSFGVLMCLHCAQRLCSDCQKKHVAMVIRKVAQKIVGLRKSSHDLEAIQMNLLIEDNIVTPQRSAINRQLDKVVEDLELTCDRAFGAAILTITEAANKVQETLQKELTDVAEVKKLTEFAVVLPALIDADEDSLEELLQRRNELRNALKSFHKPVERLATVNTDKLAVSKVALDTIRRHLEDFDFLLVGEPLDDTEAHSKEVPSQKLLSTSPTFPPSSQPLASPKQLNPFSSEPFNFA